MFSKIVSLNKTDTEIPIILISGNHNHLKEVAELKELAITKSIEKPFDFDEFQLIINNIFKNKSQEKTILLVDDDAEVNECNSQALASFYPESKIISVESAPKALVLLGKQNFDLIISDLQMPGMDGDEMILKIRRGEY